MSVCSTFSYSARSNTNFLSISTGSIGEPNVIPPEARPGDSFLRDANPGAQASAAGVSTLAVQEPGSSVPIGWQWAAKERFQLIYGLFRVRPYQRDLAIRVI